MKTWMLQYVSTLSTGTLVSLQKTSPRCSPRSSYLRRGVKSPRIGQRDVMELETLQEEAFERILYYQQRVTVAFELQKNVAGIQSDEGMVERVSMECHSETEVESGHLEEVTVYSTEKRHQTGSGTVWMKDCLRASPQTSIQSVHLRMTGIVFTHC
jgi:hypothetical protein